MGKQAMFFQGVCVCEREKKNRDREGQRIQHNCEKIARTKLDVRLCKSTESTTQSISTPTRL